MVSNSKPNTALLLKAKHLRLGAAFSFLCGIVGFLFPQDSSAQQFGGIRGQVVDSDFGQPIGKASVTVLDTPFGAMTDDQGNFTISGVPPGGKRNAGAYAERLVLGTLRLVLRCLGKGGCPANQRRDGAKEAQKSVIRGEKMEAIPA